MEAVACALPPGEAWYQPFSVACRRHMAADPDHVTYLGSCETAAVLGGADPRTSSFWKKGDVRHYHAFLLVQSWHPLGDSGLCDQQHTCGDWQAVDNVGCEATRRPELLHSYAAAVLRHDRLSTRPHVRRHSVPPVTAIAHIHLSTSTWRADEMPNVHGFLWLA